MSLIVGIDLGTTNSEIAYLRKGKPEIILNKGGGRITPSVVAVRKGEISVGETAKNNLKNNPENTVVEIKRKIGTNERVKLGGKEYLPEEISAIILKYLKESVEEVFQEEVTEAVITVPAKFNDLQRRATKRAGELAGLKIERIINEPTAAALAYGIENFENEENILVYDLGGGTFDVTILEYDNGIFDVKSSEGDNHLGGKDFDEKMVDVIIKNIKNNYDLDLGKDTSVKFNLKEVAETAKKELSTFNSTTITIPYITVNTNGESVGVDMDMTREEFENLILDDIKKTEEIIDLALKEAGMKDDEIDTVLVVGGSTRMPLVREMLKRRFGKKVRFEINPDEIVALGAAVQAGIKEGFYNNDVIITDISPYTLGVEMVTVIGGRLQGGVFDPLIEKNTTIPYSNKKVYSTLYDNQTEVNVNIYQGEDKLVINNTRIGELSVNGIPQNIAGNEEIEIEFSYNINGIIEVNATILSTGIKKGIKIGLNDQQISDSEEKHIINWEESPFASDVRFLIESAETKLDTLEQNDKDRVNKILYKLKEALVNEDKILVEQYEEELTDMLFDLI